MSFKPKVDLASIIKNEYSSKQSWSEFKQTLRSSRS